MKRKVLSLMALVVMLGSSAMPAMAQNRYYNSRNYQRPSNNQYIQKALIGGGAGAVIGSLLSNEGYRADGAVKGGLIGAGVGLGYEYLKNKDKRYW